jgi:hypothetical protein
MYGVRGTKKTNGSTFVYTYECRAAAEKSLLWLISTQKRFTYVLVVATHNGWEEI